MTTSLIIANDLPSVSRPRVRLEYIDGMRGLAALFVVLHHGHQIITSNGGRPLPAIVRLMNIPLQYGHYAVAVFIVLSGYCLMLPVARSKTRSLDGGLKRFLTRRAIRILPTYYASLLLSLALIALLPVLRAPHSSLQSTYLPAFEPKVIVSHLLLIHNFWREWVWKINRPHWSVALEWQIYFAFAFVLIPCWRRFGNVGAIVVAFTISCLPYFLLPHTRHFERTAPWLFCLFAMGMTAATVNFSHLRIDRTQRGRIPAGVSTLICVTLLLAASTVWPALGMEYQMRFDLLGGAATSFFLVYATQRSMDEPQRLPLVIRILQSPFLAGLGLFSYSLYLIHDPLLWTALIPMQIRGWSQGLQYAVLILLIVPGCILVSYGFHLLFERPFVRVLARPAKTKEIPGNPMSAI